MRVPRRRGDRHVEGGRRRCRGHRVRIDRALLMELVSTSPGRIHAQCPQSRAHASRIGGKNSVFVPMYGAPYVRDLDNKRRYGSLADLNNFHKLAYMSPALHSSSSIICEPMEIAVPKRHLHIIHSALKHSDKPFMGIVTSQGAGRGHDGDGRHRLRRGLRRGQSGRWCRSPTAIRRWSGTRPCWMP